MAMDNAERGKDLPSAKAIRVFGLIAAGETVTDDYKNEVAELVEWGYVVVDAERGNRPVALNPAEVARRRMEAELEQAAKRVAILTALPALTDQLSDAYQRAQWTTGRGSVFIDDMVEVNARLDDVIASAQSEILTAQPGGPRGRELLERSAARDQDALGRGVSMRILYRDSVRTSTAMADHVRTMTGHGAEYRTLVAPYERAIVVDRRHAFISDHVVEGAPPHAAWYVTDRAAIGFITASFTDAWNRARPWQGELRGAADGGEWGVDTVTAAGPGVRTTALQRAILRDMVAGIEQRITAGRLGISLRKLTDEIAELKGRFGATSLTQLAYKFALSDDHLVDDSTPALQAEEAGEAAA